MRTIVPPNVPTIPPNAEKVFSGIVFDIYHYPLKGFDGSTLTFEMVKRTDTVQIIAIRDGKLVVTEEQQPNTKPAFGIPGGRHDYEEETELYAANRELLEETGLSFKTWKLIKAYNPITATHKIDWLMYIFVATDFISETEQKLDAGEKITVHYMDFDEFMNISRRRGGNNDVLNDIFKQAGSIDGLINLPEYKV
jgi:ADP-ribose pyrophosphatase